MAHNSSSLAITTTTPTFKPLPRSSPIPIPQTKPMFSKPNTKWSHRYKREPPTPDEEHAYYQTIKNLSDEGHAAAAALAAATISIPLPITEQEPEPQFHMDLGVKLKNIFKKIVPNKNETNNVDSGEDAVVWQESDKEISN